MGMLNPSFNAAAVAYTAENQAKSAFTGKPDSYILIRAGTNRHGGVQNPPDTLD